MPRGKSSSQGKLKRDGARGGLGPVGPRVAVSVAGLGSCAQHRVPFFYAEPVHPTGTRPGPFQTQGRFGENQRRPPGTWGWPGGAGARGWRRHCSRSSARWWCCCRCRTRRRSPSTGRRPRGRLAERRGGAGRSGASPQTELLATALYTPDSTRAAQVGGHNSLVRSPGS